MISDSRCLFSLQSADLTTNRLQRSNLQSIDHSTKWQITAWSFRFLLGRWKLQFEGLTIIFQCSFPKAFISYHRVFSYRVSIVGSSESPTRHFIRTTLDLFYHFSFLAEQQNGTFQISTSIWLLWGFYFGKFSFLFAMYTRRNKTKLNKSLNRKISMKTVVLPKFSLLEQLKVGQITHRGGEIANMHSQLPKLGTVALCIDAAEATAISIYAHVARSSTRGSLRTIVHHGLLKVVYLTFAALEFTTSRFTTVYIYALEPRGRDLHAKSYRCWFALPNHESIGGYTQLRAACVCGKPSSWRRLVGSCIHGAARAANRRMRRWENRKTLRFVITDASGRVAYTVSAFARLRCVTLRLAQQRTSIHAVRGERKAALRLQHRGCAARWIGNCVNLVNHSSCCVLLLLLLVAPNPCWKLPSTTVWTRQLRKSADWFDITAYYRLNTK